MLLGQRPSALLSACAPPASAAPSARAYAAGQPAVSGHIERLREFDGLTVPMWGTTRTAGTSKINNSIVKSIFQGQKVSALRVHKVQVDRIQGGSARGNPPRGRPV